MQLRDYQEKAYQQTMQCFEENQAVLAVMATGLGKTIFFSHVAKEFMKSGRILLIAHREELITQGQKHLGNICETNPEIEMGERWASRGWGASEILVSSIQTQIAGRNGGRMTDFDPNEFSLVIVDEAHHSTANSYVKMLDYYKQNKNIKILGVTATPDRTDEMALQQVFDAYSFDYGIDKGVANGWLVMPHQQTLYLEGLDISHVSTKRGDLDAKEIAAIYEEEKHMLAVADGLAQKCGNKKTLVFCASVFSSEKTCEILNRPRYKPGSARHVCGFTPKDIRREMFKDYKEGVFQLLLNVGVATEGFDEPGIQIVGMDAPTKSRCKFTQMLGRVLRPCEEIVDALNAAPDATARKKIIAESSKPYAIVLDFVGNCGKHKLITPTDILGGKYSDEIVELAKEMAQEDSKAGPVDVMGELALAELEIKRRNAEEEQKSKRKVVTARAKYSTAKVNPFDIFDREPDRIRGWHKGRQMTDPQKAALEKAGVDTDGLEFTHASQLIGELIERRKQDKCSYRQAKILKRNKRSTNCSFAEANKIIDEISIAQGWGKKRK